MQVVRFGRSAEDTVAQLQLTFESLPSADIRMKVSTAGGHSSTPPQHTSIGLLAKLITELEAKPYPIELDERNAHLQFLQCTRDGPRVSPKLRQALRDLEWANRHRHRRPGVYDRRGDQRLRRAKQRVIDNLDEFGQTSFRTTQAVDLIQGGVKVRNISPPASLPLFFADTTLVLFSRLTPFRNQPKP